jgi:glycosyltransferase involved in cell wall biosynthesis
MLSIIIPTLNEEEGIAKVLCSIPKETWDRSEVLVVDASDDFTPIIAERLGAKVIKTNKKGKGWQMRYAVKKSKGDVLVFLDGDGSHPGDYIPQLLKKLRNANLVLGCGSKKIFKRDYPKMRELFILYRIFVGLPFRLINFRVSDPLAGFRALRRKDWDRLNLESNNFEIETEMNIKAIKMGFTVKEVKIPHLKRCGGLLKSKFGTNPKMWFEISKLFLRYCEDEEIKAKIKKEIKKIFFYQKF